MRPRIYSLWAGCSLLLLPVVVRQGLPAQEIDLKNPLAAIEVQTRGPVHEAFAQPQDLTPAPGLPVPKEPPPPIREEPPEQRAAGDNMQWIDGYWAWDADRRD